MIIAENNIDSEYMHKDMEELRTEIMVSDNRRKNPEETVRIPSDKEYKHMFLKSY